MEFLPRCHDPTAWPIPAEEQLPNLPIFAHQSPADVLGDWEVVGVGKGNPNALVGVGLEPHCPEALDLLRSHSSCWVLSFESWNVTGEPLSSLD